MPPIPFPRRLRKEKEDAQQKKFLENLKQLHINFPFIEALTQIPKYAKFLKGLLTNRARLEESCTITMNERCSAGLEQSIEQSDLESCESFKCKVVDDSDSGEPIRRIESINTPYLVAQKTAEPNKVESEQLYSASANEIDEKKPELKILPQHLEYAYLHGDKSFPIIILSKLSEKEKMLLLQVLEKRFFQILIASEDQEKTTFTCPYGTFAYRQMSFRLCNAPATFQRCMTAIFHDMVEDFMKVFMDDFSVFGNSFDCCLANLDRMLTRCEETNLVLNWEKCHFMVKEGIVLGHKIYGARIEVDRAKIDVIAKLPYPTNVKEMRSFLRHARFYRRFIKDFSMIFKPMTQLLMKDVNFDFSDDCKKAFNILKEKLTTAPIIISPDWKVPFELMCDASDFAVGAVLGQQIDGNFKSIYYASKTLNNAQEHYTTTEKNFLQLFSLLIRFDIKIKDKKGTDNLATDHLSRLKNPDLGTFTEKEIADKLNEDKPWYADYVNYIIGKIVPPKWTSEKRRRFFSQVKIYFWDEPYAFKLCPDNVMRRCVAGNEILEILTHCHSGPTRGHHSASITRRKVYESGFFWPSIFKDAKDYVMRCDACQRSGNISSRSEMPQNNIQIEHKAYWALKQCNMDLTAAAKNYFMELNELMELRDRAYENTQIYKERTKRWHDSRLRGDKNFKVGDKVLLFNSRFKMHPSKLKSRWYGPNVVKTVYPYGTVEIINRNEINFKVNGQRLKKYHNGHIDVEDKEVVEFEEDTT
ncbi:reverse transcriptase domain-containing protein [Tanacetum coccineum]